jgi:hypothetical protein
MTTVSIPTRLTTAHVQSSLSTDVPLAQMLPPCGVSTLQWQLSSTPERQALLDTANSSVMHTSTQAQTTKETLGQLAQAVPKAVRMTISASTHPATPKTKVLTPAVNTPAANAPAVNTITPPPTPKRKKRRRLGGLVKLKSRIKNHVKKSLKRAAARLKKNFQKLMQSKIFAAVLMVCRFIPIPIVQLVVKVIDLVKAAYTLYQGIKAGSMGAILGGIAGVAGGISDMANSVGATSLAKTAGNVAGVANKSAAAYNAIAKKDYGAALGMFISSGSNAQTRWGNLLGGAVKANSAYQAVRSGDYCGALNTGISVAKDFNGNKPDATLERLGTMAKTVTQVDQASKAVRRGDYASVVSAGTSVATTLGLTPSDPQTLSTLRTAAKVANNVIAVSQAVGQHDYLKAANDSLSTYAMLQDAPKNSTLMSLGKLTTAADAIRQSAQHGQYVQADQTAINYLRDLHGNQPHPTLDKMGDMVNAFGKVELAR